MSSLDFQHGFSTGGPAEAALRGGLSHGRGIGALPCCCACTLVEEVTTGKGGEDAAAPILTHDGMVRERGDAVDAVVVTSQGRQPLLLGLPASCMIIRA